MTLGLFVFIAVIGLDVLGLVLDLVLSLTGHETITAYVRLHPLVGWAIIVWQVIATCGLADHFWGDHG